MKIESYSTGSRRLARCGPTLLSLALFCSSAPLLGQDTRTDSARLAGLAGPTSAVATITTDSEPKDPLVRLPITLFEPWQRGKAKVEEAIGLTYGVTYQLAYSSASASIDDAESSSASGVFSASVRWTLLGRGSGNQGALTVQVENRHVYGDYSTSPQFLNFQTGSMIPTATKFSSAPTRILFAHWSQGLFGGRAGFVIGHIAPDDYFSHHQLMHPFMGFMGLGSVFSPAIHLPNPGWGVGAGAWVTDQVQVKAAVTDATGDAFGDEFWDPGDEFSRLRVGPSPPGHPHDAATEQRADRSTTSRALDLGARPRRRVARGETWTLVQYRSRIVAPTIPGGCHTSSSTDS